jgi:alpha-amylase
MFQSYEDIEADKVVINRLADECYLPANALILANIQNSNGDFKVNYSISGTVLELLMLHRPDVIVSFKEIIATGCAEILAETYYNSLSYLYSKKEFQRQVKKHQALINELFNVQPVVFRNTELIYNNHLAQYLDNVGLKGILCEGIQDVLKGRSPNQIYAIPGNHDIKLLLRNHTLSDDIAFRFDDPNWNEHPLTAGKFVGWIHDHPVETKVINLFMDYETLGIHKKKESGIFDFFKALAQELPIPASVQFSLASEVVANTIASDIFDVQHTISWKNSSGILNPWNANVMQNNTINKIYSLEQIVLKSKSETALEMWGKLQASDYFHFMTEEDAKGENYRFSSPFNSAKEIYEYYTNVVFDFEIKLIKQGIAKFKSKFSTGNWSLLNNKI